MARAHTGESLDVAMGQQSPVDPTQQPTPPTAAQSPAPAGLSSRLLVLMFTDVVNSAGTKAAIGAGPYAELVARQDRIVKQVMAELPRGQILQDTGDGYFLAFDTVGEAIDAALRFQYRMSKEPWPHPIEARVGLHLGQVAQLESGTTGQQKLLSSAVDIAARVMSLAGGRQILCTRVVFDEARQFVHEHPAVDGQRPAIRWVAHGPYLFKGADDPIEIFEVGAEGVAALTPPENNEKAKRHIRPGEEETLGWRPGANRPMPTAEHWLLQQKLGEGGFGEVWLARHAKSHSPRVFKFCFDAERLRALKREVVLFRLIKQALGDRRDIGRVIDWQFDAPPYFIEMDYAPEGNLAQWADARGGIDKVPMPERLRIVARVAEALAAAHSLAILHKDIKPSNVLMVQDATDDYYPRLTDFGIGVLTDRSRLADFNITAAGFTASSLPVYESSGSGTRMYQPPESLADKPHTVQGDVYALGVMLYQMVVADLRAPLAPGWERYVEDPLLREDIAACVDGDPQARLKSAQELADRLNNLDARRQEIAERAEAIKRAETAKRAAADAARLSERRRRLITTLAGAVLFFAIIAVGFAVLLVKLNFVNDKLVKQQKQIEDEQAARRRDQGVVDVETGLALQYSGDPALALPFFARALATEESEPRPDEIARRVQRTRLAATLAQCPAPWSIGTGSADGQPLLPVSPQPARIAPDGRTIRNKGPLVEVVDPQGKPLFALARADAPAIDVRNSTLSPKGDRVVAGYADGKAVVWDVAAAPGRPLFTLAHAPAGDTGAVFSPDGTRVVTTGQGPAQVWDASSGQRLGQVGNGEGPAVRSVAFDHAGTRLATVAADGAVSVWAFPDTGRQLGKTVAVGRAVNFVELSPFGPHVVAVCGDNVARICDSAAGRVVGEIRHGGAINAAAVGLEREKNRLWVATASKDAKVRFWCDAQGMTADKLDRYTITLPDEAYDVAFNPANPRQFATACKDGTARVWLCGQESWDDRWLTPNIRHRGPVLALAFTPDGRGLVTATWDLSVFGWSIPPARVPYPNPDFGVATNVDWVEPDSGGTGRSVLEITGNRAAVVNLADGRAVASISGHDARITAAVFLDGGGGGTGPGIIATGGDDAQVILWNPGDGARLRAFPKLDAPARLLATDAPADRLVAVTAAGTVYVGDIATGQWTTTRRRNYPGTVRAFNRDLSAFVTTDDRTAHVYPTSGTQPLSTGMTHSGKISGASFSPDATRVLTWGEDFNARVWDAATGRKAAGDMRHLDKVLHAAFSPDGRRVVTAGKDKLACVWDAATGTMICQMDHTGEGEVDYAAFSPDGLFVATAMDMYSARVWDARNGQPVSAWIEGQVRTVDHVWFAGVDKLILHCKKPGLQERRVYTLGALDWPAEDIDKMAKLLSGRRLPGATHSLPLSPADYTDLLQQLSSKHPEAFGPPKR